MGYVIIYLYMDDMFILGNKNYIIKSTKKILTNKFEIKDLGVANIILRIKCFRISDRLILSQPHYVEKSLDKFSKGDYNIVKILIDISVYLSKNKGKGIDQLKYS